MNINLDSASLNLENSEKFEQDYNQVFKELHEFINAQKPTKSKRNSPRKSISKYVNSIFKSPLFIILLAYCSPLIFSSTIFLLRGFIANHIWLFWLLAGLYLSFLIVIAVMGLIKAYQETRDFEKLPNEVIDKCRIQGLDDLKYSQKISKLPKSAIVYAEKRLKLLIDNRGTFDKQLNTIIPFISLALSGFLIYWLKIPNLNFTVSNLVVIGGIIGIGFRGLIELTDKPKIYKRCLAIVEYAQILADKPQEDELQFLPKPQKSGKKLFDNLENYIVDKASGFDYNSSEK